MSKRKALGSNSGDEEEIESNGNDDSGFEFVDIQNLAGAYEAEESDSDSDDQENYFVTGLKTWAKDPDCLEEERESRKAAIEIIINTKKNETDILSLEGFGLSSLPEQIAELDFLKELQLSENNLSSIPDWISNLVSLKVLDLSDNQIQTIPPEIGNLTSLESLHLGGNRIETIPPELGKLISLESLHLGGNQIETIPPEIGNLVALQALDLQDNRINTLIDEIENLNCLIDLNLSSNELSTILESLLTSPAGFHRTIRLEDNSISPEEAARLSELALAGGGVTLIISIQDQQDITEDQQQELANSIIGRILLKAPEEKKEELKILLDSEQLPNFKLFLAVCPRTEAWKSHEPEMTQCLFEVVNKMSESEAIKIKCETLAETGLGSCGDRVGLTFVQMQLALNLSDKKVMYMNPQEVYDYAKQESVIKFLSDKAETRIKKMRTEGGVLDVIETHLAYLQIGSDLGLNLRANGMLYPKSSNVTADDLESAKAEFQALDLHLQTAKHLYEDGMLRTHPFVQGVITEVGGREKFYVGQKEGENEYEYMARAQALRKLIEEAAIIEIGLRCDGLRSAVEASSVSAEESASLAPGVTITPIESRSVVRDALEQEL
jgi:hypothetical protein